MTVAAGAPLVVFCVSNVGADNPIASRRVAARLSRGGRLHPGLADGLVVAVSSDVMLVARPLTRTTLDAPVTGTVPTSGCDEVDAAASAGGEQRCGVVVVVVVGVIWHERFSIGDMLVAQLAIIPAMCSGL